jgi:chromosome partitioning protein
MRRICIINQKGGVAKTTTAVNLAAGLARKNRRVLLIDLDPQGSTTFSLEWKGSKDLFDYLTTDIKLRDCVAHLGKNLDLLGTQENLSEIEKTLAQEKNKIKTIARRLREIDNYDYVILDTSPSLNVLNIAVMLASDEALIPTSTDVLGLRGTTNTIKLIESNNEKYDHSLKITKIVPTLYDQRNRICRRMLEIMNNIYYDQITDPIRVNSRLKEAPEQHKSIFTYDKSSRGAEDYGKLVVQVINDENFVTGGRSMRAAATA